MHHVAVVNDIITNSGVGVNLGNCSGSSSVASFDYIATVGSAVFDSNFDAACVSAINYVGPKALDANAGTHNYVYGNIAWFNDPKPRNCGSDTQGIIFDSWDLHNYVQQAVIANNIVYTSAGSGLQLFEQGNSTPATPMHVTNNTFYSNTTDSPFTGGNNTLGESTNHSSSNSISYIMTFQNNIFETTRAADQFGNFLYAQVINDPTPNGFTSSGNIFKGHETSCQNFNWSSL